MTGTVDKIETVLGNHPLLTAAATAFLGYEFKDRVEQEMVAHPLLTAVAAAFAGHELDGHGALRMGLDAYAAYEEAKGTAGVFSKAVLAEDARETAMKIAEKGGKGWLGQQLAGVLAFGSSYHEEGVIERDILAIRNGQKPGAEAGSLLTLAKPLMALAAG